MVSHKIALGCGQFQTRCISFSGNLIKQNLSKNGKWSQTGRAHKLIHGDRWRTPLAWVHQTLPQKLPESKERAPRQKHQLPSAPQHLLPRPPLAPPCPRSKIDRKKITEIHNIYISELKGIWRLLQGNLNSLKAKVTSIFSLSKSHIWNLTKLLPLTSSAPCHGRLWLQIKFM